MRRSVKQIRKAECVFCVLPLRFYAAQQVQRDPLAVHLQAMAMAKLDVVVADCEAS